MNANHLNQLIDSASSNAGNDSKLAKELFSSKQAVSDWRHGRKTCPAADVALMAHIAGLDAVLWAANALIAQHAGTPKGKKLEKALNKALCSLRTDMSEKDLENMLKTEKATCVKKTVAMGFPHTPKPHTGLTLIATR